MDVKNVKNVLRKEKHMNKTNKLLSLLLVLTIVFSLSVTALAADTTYTITVDGSGTVANHTFEAYQIFSGDLHAPETGEGGNTSKILSNIVWGTGVNTNADGFTADFPSLPLKQQNADNRRAGTGLCQKDRALPLRDPQGRFRQRRRRQLRDLRSAGRLLSRQGQG